MLNKIMQRHKKRYATVSLPGKSWCDHELLLMPLAPAQQVMHFLADCCVNTRARIRQCLALTMALNTKPKPLPLSNSLRQVPLKTYENSRS
jgi:hypothetical protein